MPAVIDSLVVSLGLDPSEFTKGQKQAVDSLRATETQAARTAKELESRGKQAAQFYSKIRNEVLALGAAFFGARGIEEFTRRMTAADTATGLLARNLGTSTENLSTWEGVARRSGATAGDAATSMQNLVSQFQNFSLTGQGGDFIRFFQILGVSATDGRGKLKSLNDLIMEVASSPAWQKMTGPEKQAFGAGLGFTPGFINVLSQNPDELRRKFADQARDAVTDADVAAALKLQNAWEGVRLSFDSLGRTILTDVTPSISALLDELREFIEQNKEEIGQNFKAFAEWLRSLDWKAIGDNIKAFAQGADSAAKAVGGWVTVTEILFGLWVGSKFAAVIANVLRLAGAAGAAAEGAAATLGVGAAVVSAPVAGAVAVAAAMAPSTTNAGEDELIRAHPEMFPKPPSKAERDELVVGPPGRNWWQAWKAWNFPDQDAAEPPAGSLPAATRPRTKPPVSARRPSGQQSDVDTLVGLGWSREQALGIAANLQRESSGIATKTGDGGQAYGLAQWHPDRQAAFAKWAGHDIRSSTRAEQLGFIDYELRQGGERRAGKALKQATSAADAAAIVSRYYERPANADAEAARRSALALALASQPGPAPDTALLAGARAGVAATAAGQRVSSVSHTTDVNISQITVNTAATDSDGIAKGIGTSVRKYSFLPQANQGLT